MTDQDKNIVMSSIEEIIGKLLQSKSWTLTTAESCTGGFIAHSITNVPGSSSYFKSGFIIYSLESKKRILDLEEKIIENFGVYSPETAIAMANNVRKIANATIGLSTTGIAPPGDDKTKKPIGLSFVGISSSKIQEFRQFDIKCKSREEFKQKLTKEALEFLESVLMRAVEDNN